MSRARLNLVPAADQRATGVARNRWLVRVADQPEPGSGLRRILVPEQDRAAAFVAADGSLVREADHLERPASEWANERADSVGIRGFRRRLERPARELAEERVLLRRYERRAFQGGAG